MALAFFLTRLALYLIAISMPFLHPAIVVRYDSVAMWTLFILVPIEMAFAFSLRTPRFSVKVALGVPLVLLLVLTLAVTRLGASLWWMLFVGGVGYLSTFLIFQLRSLGRIFAPLELFAISYVYYKLLAFSRASPDVAEASSGITVVLLAFAIAAFLLHAVLLYLLLFPAAHSGRWRREPIALALLLVPLALAIAFFVPSDFIEHNVVFNELEEEPPPNPQPLGEGDDEAGDAAGRGGGRGDEEHSRDGRPLGNRLEKYPPELQRGMPSESDGSSGGAPAAPPPPNGGDGSGEEGSQPPPRQQQGGGGQGEESQNRVEGVPAEQWNNLREQMSASGESSHQFAEMVISSPIQPIYAAESYRGDLDPIEGFLPAPAEREPLNELASLRLLESWQSRTRSDDTMREPIEIFYLSTMRQRQVAYLPWRIEPTVRDVTYHPFELSYRAISLVSMAQPEEWQFVGELSDVERQRLASSLELSVAADMLDAFRLHIESALAERLRLRQLHLPESGAADPADPAESAEDGELAYFEKIDTILRSLSGHKYHAGFDDDSSIAHLHHFLVEEKVGDCVEFAHTAALLGRIAGIPSRVVYGYVASEDLQTPAHRRGLAHLRQRIRPLRDYPLEELYLVTSSHRHAWVQYYLPRFGWVDFEATAYAIPPDPGGNPNELDILIPLIEEERAQKFAERRFPWRAAAIVFGSLLLTLLIVLYLWRYGREIYLRIVSHRRNRRGLDAMLQLLCMRLATRGYQLRAPFQTPLDYSLRATGPGRALPQGSIDEFAHNYARLRFRLDDAAAHSEEEWLRLYKSYRFALDETKRRGALSLLRRIFSLRGLYY